MSRSKLSGIECLSPFAALVKLAVNGLVGLSLKGCFSNKLELILARPSVYSFIGKLSIIILVLGGGEISQELCSSGVIGLSFAV